MTKTVLMLEIGIVVIVLLAAVGESKENVEQKLLNELFVNRNYMQTIRPGPVDKAVDSRLTFSIQQVIDVDEKNQILVTNVILKLQWFDERLIWDPEQFENLSQIRVSPSKLWRPDVLLYNNVKTSFEPTYPALVVVNSDGWLLWKPPGIVSSSCKIDITYFPFDQQTCMFQYGTWTHDANKISMLPGDPNGTGIERSQYVENGEWDLVDIQSHFINTTFPCCPEPWYYIQFFTVLSRRTLSYGFNLIIPCLVISFMALLCFILPAGTDEKLTLGISIFMSLTMFLIIIADKLPPTSESYPLIGTYFMATFIVVSLSQVATVLTINFHHRHPDCHEMSPMIRSIFLDFLPRLLKMKRPGYEVKRGKLVVAECTKTRRSIAESFSLAITQSKSSDRLLIDFLRAKNEPQNQNNAQNKSGSTNNNSYSKPSIYQLEMMLKCILTQLQKVTDRIREDDDEQDIIDDWQFAAMVLDRACLYIFSMLMAATCCIILVAAPHIF